MTTKMPTFEVDKDGLSRLMRRQGSPGALAFRELVANAYDEDGVTKVDVVLRPLDGDLYELAVDDDAPEGFANLAHAYVLFAESAKKGEAEKRGRFNLGEKLVVAVCERATIITTKGTVEFRDGGRFHSDDALPAGSRFVGEMRMTEAEAEEALALTHRIIAPDGIETIINGEPLERRQPVRSFKAELRTEKPDENGYLRPTRRVAVVDLHEPREGEQPTLYELGMPVVDADCAWHVDVRQKVPLSVDRDNVTPGWLRDLRAEVLNAAHDLLTPANADAKWVDDGLADERAESVAAAAIVKARYGDKVVTPDPSDREGEKIAVSKGYTVIPAGAFSKDAWRKVREAQVALPAGQVTPSPRPDIGKEGIEPIDPDDYTVPVAEMVARAASIGHALLGKVPKVQVVNAMSWPFVATYGPGHGLTLNLGRLGYAWFNEFGEKQVALLIHEFAHEKVSDHLSREFYDECCRLGAKLALLAAERPELLTEATEAVPA